MRLSLRNEFALLFFVGFLLCGGMVIGIVNIEYLSNSVTFMAGISLCSFSLFCIMLFWDELRDLMVGFGLVWDEIRQRKEVV